MKKFSNLFLVLSLLVLACISINTPKSMAFSPNILIDDTTFDDYNSMNTSQIDNFLNSFANSCISTNNGFSSPLPIGYNPSTGFTFGANISAGNVIYQSAQVYGLNPKVILTTLQKEQSLVTGGAGCHPSTPDPSSAFQCNLWGSGNISCTQGCTYSGGCIPIALGYNCPYNCQLSSEGFSQQVIRATWKLKFDQQRSLGNVGWNVQKAGWDNSDDPVTSYNNRMTQGFRKRSQSSALTFYDGLYSICESGSTGCQSVQITSGATAALYNYTPFFSGNRSFTDKFEAWFGASYSPDMYTDNDSDGLVNRYDICPSQAGKMIYQGCLANSNFGSNGYEGDFNGDGFGDMVVFSVYPDSKTFGVWMYSGSATGLQNPISQMVLGPNFGGWDFNKSKAIAVNFNGDAYMDLVIFHQGPNNEIVRNILKGSATGLLPADPTMVVWQTPAEGWRWDYLKVAGAGDVNGDGFGDVVVFVHESDGRGFNVWTYSGSLAGLQPPALQINLSPATGGWSITQSKAVVTNVNGDTYSDLVILHQGPNNEVVRHVLKGSASGLTASDPAWVNWQFPAQGWLWSNLKIAGAGDFNGDGFSDVMVFSIYPDGKTFGVWMYSGSATGLQNPISQMVLGPNFGGWDINKTKAVATNVNRDAYVDLAILHQGPRDEIVRHILKGSASGLQLSDQTWVTWQFPAQGWLWSGVQILNTNN